MQSVNIFGKGKTNSGSCDRMVSGQESCHEEEGLGGMLVRRKQSKLTFLSLLTSLSALGIVLLQ